MFYTVTCHVRKQFTVNDSRINWNSERRTSKRYSHLKKGKKEDPGNFRCPSLTLMPRDGDGAAKPGDEWQAHVGQ